MMNNATFPKHPTWDLAWPLLKINQKSKEEASRVVHKYKPELKTIKSANWLETRFRAKKLKYPKTEPGRKRRAVFITKCFPENCLRKAWHKVVLEASHGFIWGWPTHLPWQVLCSLLHNRSTRHKDSSPCPHQATLLSPSLLLAVLHLEVTF